MSGGAASAWQAARRAGRTPVANEPGQGWAAGMAELLVDSKLAADRARAGWGRVDHQVRVRLRGRYCRLLADGQAASPPPRTARRVRRSPAANLLARLDRHRDEVLRSLDDTRVPFDNNQAEHDLRMVKLQQKNAGALPLLDVVVTAASRRAPHWRCWNWSG
jgi:transposase